MLAGRRKRKMAEKEPKKESKTGKIIRMILLYGVLALLLVTVVMAFIRRQ